ncbi:MAG: ABC transporter permease, partial [Chitinophagaceae bacterium]|nr:ABC transporter permease [Chitinophagaceae bacterium]
LSNQVIGRKPGPIIGVVKDFHYHSLHETIEPLYLFMKKDWFTQLNIRIDERRTAATLASLKNLWAEVEPQFPFKYTFLDEGFQAFYESEQRISKLLFWFTVLAILISCMGLFALSTLVAEQRAREIGIRKVLGASVSGIVTLLSRDFLKPVLIAFVLAAPITWYFMDQWLQDFAYKTTIAWWIFAVAGIIAMLIALLTTSFQAIKAAWANPVKSLRTE